MKVLFETFFALAVAMFVVGFLFTLSSCGKLSSGMEESVGLQKQLLAETKAMRADMELLLGKADTMGCDAFKAEFSHIMSSHGLGSGTEIRSH